MNGWKEGREKEKEGWVDERKGQGRGRVGSEEGRKEGSARTQVSKHPSLEPNAKISYRMFRSVLVKLQEGVLQIIWNNVLLRKFRQQVAEHSAKRYPYT